MSISDTVRLYLKNKPYMVEALQSGIVNYSALARMIQRELRLKQYHAVKAALRRHAVELMEKELGIERHAISILRQSTVTIQGGVMIIISDAELGIQSEGKMRLSNYYMYLLNKKISLKSLGKRLNQHVVKVHEDASAIIIHSEEKLEAIPGFVAFIASILAEQNINILEFVSYYTETLIIVGRGDAIKSHELLLSMT